MIFMFVLEGKELYIVLEDKVLVLVLKTLYLSLCQPYWINYHAFTNRSIRTYQDGPVRRHMAVLSTMIVTVILTITAFHSGIAIVLCVTQSHILYSQSTQCCGFYYSYWVCQGPHRAHMTNLSCEECKLRRCLTGARWERQLCTVVGWCQCQSSFYTTLLSLVSFYACSVENNQEVTRLNLLIMYKC